MSVTEDLEGLVFQSLRQCATHPGGPLKAIATVQAAWEADDLTYDEWNAIWTNVEQRYQAQKNVPIDRIDTVGLFLRAFLR